MPWTTPGTATAGDVLTAARWNTEVRDNSLMGNPVFTNEAARDAAITAPVEGQTCYLTTPTTPSATGGTTFIPTGIRTIYNGSAWVCVTPVGAFTTNSGTTTSTSLTGTLSGTPGTNPSVTLSTGSTVLVHIGSFLNVTVVDYITLAVAVSGATTIAADASTGMYFRPDSNTQNNQINSGQTVIIGGLTAGANTFTLNYSVGSGTGTFSNRRITVIAIA